MLTKSLRHHSGRSRPAAAIELGATLDIYERIVHKPLAEAAERVTIAHGLAVIETVGKTRSHTIAAIKPAPIEP